jgi:hypothetical protein
MTNSGRGSNWTDYWDANGLLLARNDRWHTTVWDFSSKETYSLHADAARRRR